MPGWVDDGASVPACRVGKGAPPGAERGHASAGELPTLAHLELNGLENVPRVRRLAKSLERGHAPAARHGGAQGRDEEAEEH